MDIGSILIMAVLAVLAAMFISRPLVEGGRPAINSDDRRLSSLKAELEQALSLIQEMDMDYTMEKILPEDYQVARAELVGRGAGLMKEIDRLEEAGMPKGMPARTQVEAEIEAAVASLRGRGDETPGGFCPQCGQAVLAGDRFCLHCGSPLPPEGVKA